MEQRKYIPFMIAFAHRDHTFRGMDMLSCSLASFVQVNSKYHRKDSIKLIVRKQIFIQILRASASYYLMIKKL